jgi:hypothetical protein
MEIAFGGCYIIFLMALFSIYSTMERLLVLTVVLLAMRGDTGTRHPWKLAEDPVQVGDVCPRTIGSRGMDERRNAACPDVVVVLGLSGECTQRRDCTVGCGATCTGTVIDSSNNPLGSRNSKEEITDSQPTGMEVAYFFPNFVHSFGRFRGDKNMGLFMTTVGVAFLIIFNFNLRRVLRELLKMLL